MRARLFNKYCAKNTALTGLKGAGLVVVGGVTYAAAFAAICWGLTTAGKQDTPILPGQPQPLIPSMFGNESSTPTSSQTGHWTDHFAGVTAAHEGAFAISAAVTLTLARVMMGAGFCPTICPTRGDQDYSPVTEELEDSNVSSPGRLNL